MELSRRAVGKLIGVAAVGAATAGSLGSFPAAAQEIESSPQTTFRLFPHTNGPRTPASYKGKFLAGVAFEVTAGGCWLEGYWWWVCHRKQSTKPQKFALWQVYFRDKFEGTLIKSATVDSRRLHAGRWNYVALKRPVPLAIGATYVVATGLNGNFPITKHVFGKGDRQSSGIKSGPLFAYSDSSGLHPSPFGGSQALFSVAGNDPTKRVPTEGDGESSNFWMDLQISDRAPKGATHRLWPNYPFIPGTFSNDTGEQTTGTEFKLSQSCHLAKIWFYSPPGAKELPSRCAVWDVPKRSVVAGTDKQSPSWSGRAGSGWVSVSYSGVTLPKGDYKTAIFSAGGHLFYQENVDYFSSGPGKNGITAGPLSSPNVAKAAPCISNSLGTQVTGNSTYQDGPWSYPFTFDTKDHGENRWVDVEVTPA